MSTVEFARPTAAFTCPECGWAGDFETRFPAWCLACSHGADPGVKPVALGRRALRRKEAVARRSERLYERLVTASTLRPTAPLRLAVLAFAVFVHLVTAAILTCGIALVVLMPHTVGGWVIGPLLTALAVTLRPRVIRIEGENRLLSRHKAPHLFGLLEEIAAAMGTRAIDTASLSKESRAGTFSYGLRGRRHLIVGVPLWEVLTPQERVAVLAHECAHGANGDGEYGLVIGSALRTLRKWYELTHPWTPRRVLEGRDPRTRTLVDLILPIHLVYRLGSGLLRRSTPRAEYLADQLAAEVASSEALVATLERLVTARAAMEVLGQAVKARVPSDPWRLVRDYAEAMPEHERLRLALLAEREGQAVDATHPPNHLRIRMIRERPERPARVVLTPERWAAIDAELAPTVRGLGASIVEFARR